MSWFNASQLSSFAKQALSQAQKSIDRVLDIQEEEPSAWAEAIPYGEPGKRVPGCRACLPSDPSPACLALGAGPADLRCHSSSGRGPRPFLQSQIPNCYASSAFAS